MAARAQSTDHPSGAPVTAQDLRLVQRRSLQAEVSVKKKKKEWGVKKMQDLGPNLHLCPRFIPQMQSQNYQLPPKVLKKVLFAVRLFQIPFKVRLCENLFQAGLCPTHFKVVFCGTSSPRNGLEKNRWTGPTNDKTHIGLNHNQEKLV